MYMRIVVDGSSGVLLPSRGQNPRVDVVLDTGCRGPALDRQCAEFYGPLPDGRAAFAQLIGLQSTRWRYSRTYYYRRRHCDSAGECPPARRDDGRLLAGCIDRRGLRGCAGSQSGQCRRLTSTANLRRCYRIEIRRSNQIFHVRVLNTILDEKMDFSNKFWLESQ